MTIFFTAWIAASIGFTLGWAIHGRMKDAEANLEIERLRKIFQKTAPVIIKEMKTDARN